MFYSAVGIVDRDDDEDSGDVWRIWLGRKLAISRGGMDGLYG